MIRGIAVTLYEQADAETPVTVENVLVGEPSTEDIANALTVYGRRAAYQMALPKGDAHVWTGGSVVLPEPVAGVYRVIGFPTAGIEANIPLRWNRKILLAREEAATPCVVTLYNVVKTTDEATFADTLTNHITVLDGVMLDRVDGARARTDGDEGDSAVRLYIPFDANASDGNGGARRYAEPKAFAAASDKASLWTLTDDAGTFFAVGRVVDEAATLESLSAARDGVYLVRRVRQHVAHGGDIWQFEVEGT